MEFFPQHISENFDTYSTSEVVCKGGVLLDSDNNELINNRAIHGDIVYLKENQIVGIRKRSEQHIVGILQLNKNQKYGFTKRGIPIIKFIPLSNKYPTFMVPSKSKERKALYCVITLNKWDTTNKVPIGKIEKIIGTLGDKKCEIESILYKNSLYPRRVKIVTKDPGMDIESSKHVYETFSVDPDGCRDIDDAFHVTINESSIEVGIHIADVASRIDLDKLNINFFSSIYLDDKQINMLSDKLTFDEASLGNGEIKTAISLLLNYKFDESKNKYTLTDFKFNKCCVKNKALTYKKADKLIAKDDITMRTLYNIMKQFTQTSDINTPIPATKIVEYYMLLYNTLTAETLYKENPATVLRRHTKLEGVKFEGVASEALFDYLNKIQQNAAEYIRGDAVDSSASLSHESLGFKYYTHATSPIRRFVDVINQANILNLINKSGDFKTVTTDYVASINQFNKNLRKFYNNYKKLKLVFSEYSFEDKVYNAFITEIKEYKIKIFIPDLDIEHHVKISSKKLSKLDVVQVGEYDSFETFKSVTVMGHLLEKYNKIKIAITILPNEPVFNNKIYCKMIEPDISIL